MKRIDTATKAVDLFGSGKHGFKDGNKSLGIAATVLDASIFNSIQEELANFIELSGETLNPNDNAQMFGIAKASKQLNLVALTSTGNFTTPANITTATVFEITLVGGGGGGGGCSALTSCADSGGAGAAVRFLVSGLSPSTAYPVVVGSAGTGGAAGVTGGTGGTTQITINGVVYSCTGGVGGPGKTTGGANGTTNPQGIVSASITSLPFEKIYQTISSFGFYVSSTYTGCNGAGLPFGTAGMGGRTGNASFYAAVSGYGVGGGGGVADTGAGGAGAPGLFEARWVA